MAISEIFGTVKTLNEVVSKYNDVPMMREVNSLSLQITELVQENGSLKREVQELNDLLNLEKKMEFKQGRWYEQFGDNVPFCPHCWEHDRKALHLKNYSSRNGDLVWHCFKCKWQFPSEEEIAAQYVGSSGGAY